MMRELSVLSIRLHLGIASLAFVALAACGDDGGKSPLGATCVDSDECQSGLCRESVCVDPLVIGDGSSPVVAYVTRDNTGSNISVLAVGADGLLTEHPGSPFSTGTGNATETVFTSDGRHAYAGSGSNGDVPVHALDLAAPDYTPATNPNPPLENSSGLKRWDAVVIHPNGGFIFAADAESDGDRVYAYAIDTGAEPGRLMQTDSSVDVSDVTMLEMDPLGRYLIAANEHREFGIFDVAPSGSPDGTLGTTVEQAAPDFLRSIRFGAKGEAIYMLTTDQLHAFSFDRATGELSEVLGSPFEMAGGDVLEVDPKGRFLYETGRGGPVYLHRINPTGTVALVDADSDELNGLTGYLDGFSDLAFGGGGANLFATGGSTANFAVGSEGFLTLLAEVPVSGDRIAVFSLRP